MTTSAVLNVPLNFYKCQTDLQLVYDLGKRDLCILFKLLQGTVLQFLTIVTHNIMSKILVLYMYCNAGVPKPFGL